MLRILLFLTLAMVPSSAAAGIRAVYYVGERLDGFVGVVEVGDNGDVRADLSPGRHLVVRAGEAFLVTDRLTGPVVTRVDDLAALLADARQTTIPPARPPFVRQGEAEIIGRTGRVYYFRNASGAASDRRLAVMSDDADLAGLGSAMRRLFEVDRLLMELDEQFPPEVRADQIAYLEVLREGAPLEFGHWQLRALESVPLPPERFDLPAEAESLAALRSRRSRERAEERTGSDDDMISRALFADGRLWLLDDSGSLSSLAEGETRRTSHDLAAPVIDICRAGDMPIAVTGSRDQGLRWSIHGWRQGRWQRLRTVDRAGETVVGLSCGANWSLLLTSGRLVDLRGDDPALALTEPLRSPRLTSAIHPTEDAVFVGFNAGEWGGGMRRIDRATGRLTRIERNATGGLCDGPLNTDCDPVHAIVTLPWKPRCVAAAIGLIHMSAHGRLVEICPDGIAQMFAAAADVDPLDSQAAAEAAEGRYGSVAFFGLTVVGDGLIAAGHNGLYEIAADGRSSHQPWPRFQDVDGVLVSFARPDVILVITGINARASLSGGVPLMVAR